MTLRPYLWKAPQYLFEVFPEQIHERDRSQYRHAGDQKPSALTDFNPFHGPLLLGGVWVGALCSNQAITFMHLNMGRGLKSVKVPKSLIIKDNNFYFVGLPKGRLYFHSEGRIALPKERHWIGLWKGGLPR
ncbi:hypothetical protein NITGR_360087 [Nitrospina gracilis 3/211]|uniref:Uncharacterized protein n=1 Tax=Nitrospina gracilis (strain 3/211) TaxID=1266370 RepID=M1YYI0_NITG3|nr:hypothetical protein NITGR_360087 [Nitrospina gracilis 3/211]